MIADLRQLDQGRALVEGQADQGLGHLEGHGPLDFCEDAEGVVEPAEGGFLGGREAEHSAVGGLDDGGFHGSAPHLLWTSQIANPRRPRRAGNLPQGIHWYGPGRLHQAGSE